MDCVEPEKVFARYFFTFDASKMFLEPLLVISWAVAAHLFFDRSHIRIPLAGYRSTFETAPIAVYLFATAHVMFLYQTYCWYYRRQRLLDEQDALILLQARQLAVKPTSEYGLQTHRGVAYLPRHITTTWLKADAKGDAS